MLRQERLPDRKVDRFKVLDRKSTAQHLQKAKQQGKGADALWDKDDNLFMVQLTIILKLQTWGEKIGTKQRQYAGLVMPPQKIGKSPASIKVIY